MTEMEVKYENGSGRESSSFQGSWKSRNGMGSSTNTATILSLILAVLGVILAVTALVLVKTDKQMLSDDQLAKLGGVLKDKLDSSIASNAITSKRVDALNKTLLTVAPSRRVIVDPGWYTPGNGYQYHVTNTSQNWQSSKTACSVRGGWLAYVGIRNTTAIRDVANALLSGRGRTWIGLHDLAVEGVWVYSDGIVATQENTPWITGQPSNSGSGEDCAEINVPNYDPYEVNDHRCVYGYVALCEKWLR